MRVVPDAGPLRRGHARPVSSAATLVALPTERPIWSRFFTVAPLVLVATKEGDGWDVAPKHMAMPLGWENYYGFVCSPRHSTYSNVREHGAFTVSFPHPAQVVQASLAASGRDSEGGKPGLEALPTFPATAVDGVLVSGCGLFLECELDRIVDGFGDNCLIAGRVVAAHADERLLRLHDRDDADLVHSSPLLAYVSPGRFASVSDTRSFPFHADFSL
jgi:flavin reductase (DIM6/NTAB) family NADH-FMN oxidoreductase RutF